jgi:hypothetical protein
MNPLAWVGLAGSSVLMALAIFAIRHVRRRYQAGSTARFIGTVACLPFVIYALFGFIYPDWWFVITFLGIPMWLTGAHF